MSDWQIILVGGLGATAVIIGCICGVHRDIVSVLRWCKCSPWRWYRRRRQEQEQVLWARHKTLEVVYEIQRELRDWRAETEKRKQPSKQTIRKQKAVEPKKRSVTPKRRNRNNG